MPIPKDLKDVVLVTHRGCMDGAGCSIMFMRAGGIQANISYVTAGTLERFLKDELQSLAGKFLLIADVGLNPSSKDKYVEMLEQRGDVLLVDHHKTSEHLKDLDWCVVRQDACGTELLRRELGLDDDNSKAIAEVIQDHDIWLRKHPRSEDLATFVTFVGCDEFIRRFVHRNIVKGPIFTEHEEEMLSIVKAKRDSTIDYLVDRAVLRPLWYKGKNVTAAYVITGESNVSLLLDTVLKRHDVDVAVQVNFDRDSVSMRSRNGTDVSWIAQNFGGGGHSAAAGHRLDPELKEKVLDSVHT